MNGYMIGGLGDGLVQGFEAVTKWKALQAEQERQKKQDEADATYKQHAMGLADVQMDMSKQQLALQQQKQAADEADAQARRGILSESLGLDKQKTAGMIDLKRGELALKQRQVGLQDAENSRQEQDQQYQNLQNAYKAREMKRVEGLQYAQTQLYPKMQAGTLTPEDADKWKEATGLSLHDLSDDKFVDEAVGVFHGLKTGQVKLDDPRLNAVADRLYGPMLQRGIGDKVKMRDASGNPTGPEITVTGKSWAGAYPTNNGRFGVNAWVIGKDSEGKEMRYLAPVTMHGTGSAEDPIISFSGDEMERPLVATMYFNHAFNSDPVLKGNIDRVLRDGAEDGKTGAEREKIAADADLARSRAALYRQQTETGRAGGGSKEHEAKMRDIRALVNQRYGGKLNMLTDKEIGADRNGWDSVLDGAEQILKANPETSSAEAFTRARKIYETGTAKSGKPDPAEHGGGNFEEGKVYRDAKGNKAIYHNGKFEPAPGQ